MTDHSQLIHSSDDHGLSQHDADGENIGMSTHNIDGGEIYVKDGHIVAESHPNLQDGLEVYRNGEHVLHTERNVITGGQNVFHGPQFLGETHSNSNGGTDFDHQGYPGVSSIPLGHGFDTVMTHDDPLANTSDYQMTPLDLLAANIIPH
jgi:hypothetical protein